MCTINAIEQSTYRTSYRGELPSLPSIKYKRLPCLYAESLKTSESDKSYKPIPLARAKRPAPQPVKVSTESIINLNVGRPKSAKKNVTFRNTVFDTKFGPMDSALIDTLYNKRRYSTFTQSAAQEFALPYSRPEPPKTTQEPKADMVRLRGQRYDDAPHAWQDAVLWDRIQSRAITEGCDNIDKTPRSPKGRERRIGDKKLLQKRNQTTEIDKTKHDTIVNLVKTDGLANVFVRKCPGYAGYIPLCPPETRLDDKKTQKEGTSLMTSSYGKFPDSHYMNPRNAKKGPFSKTVTLTAPLNPYNKIGQEKAKVDKESQYMNMKEYLTVLPTIKFPDSHYMNPRNAKKGPFSKTVTLTAPLNPYNKIGQEKAKVDKESQYMNMKEYLTVLPTMLE